MSETQDTGVVEQQVETETEQPEQETPETEAQTGAPQTEDGASSGGQEDLTAKLKEYRSIQAGLDKRVTQLQTQLGREVQRRKELEAELVEERKRVESSTQTLGEYEGRVPELEAQIATLTEQLKEYGGEAKRANIIAAEFPQLAPLLEVGALPTFEDEEAFRAKAQEISDKMGIAASEQAQKRLQGARPPASPPSQDTPPKGDILQSMNDALEAGDSEKFNLLQRQWEQLIDV